MLLDGRPVRMTAPAQAVKAGIALITEDRKAQGLAVNQSVGDNALLVIRSVFARRTGEVRRELPGVLSSLEVASQGLDQEVQYLSGGNQQKVVLAKWLATKPRVVLLDEPTRGIDVGAKVAVYQLMRRLAKEGVAILMISSELPEVIGMSDRIIVMHDGHASPNCPRRATRRRSFRRHRHDPGGHGGPRGIRQHRRRRRGVTEPRARATATVTTELLARRPVGVGPTPCATRRGGGAMSSTATPARRGRRRRLDASLIVGIALVAVIASARCSWHPSAATSSAPATSATSSPA